MTILQVIGIFAALLIFAAFIIGLSILLDVLDLPREGK
jgi:hypothetical protein